MKILLIGASGTIGKRITPVFAQKYEVITAGRSSGNIIVDISSITSIENLFKQANNIDAVVCVAGDSVTSDLSLLTADQLYVGIQQKLLAQINLVLIGQHYLNTNGSFTLVSGKMGDRPGKGSAGKSVVNGGINSFVLAAALEMPRGIRINVASPAKVADIPNDDLIAGYLKAIETSSNGEIIRIGYN
jgi:NAD(P)-dependent dehydrogenase (short-subunit alcohol dehydrogenase family)